MQRSWGKRHFLVGLVAFIFGLLLLSKLWLSFPSGERAAAQPVGDASRGKDIYAQNCVICHGESGQGNGPGASGLSPKPKNFTDPVGMAKVTRELMLKAVTEGGAAVGVSSAMPSFKESLSAQERQDVIEYVRQTFMHAH